MWIRITELARRWVAHPSGWVATRQEATPKPTDFRPVRNAREMLLFALLFLNNAGIIAAEDPLSYPLWDGRETVAAYALRAHLSPTKQLKLSDKVQMEFVLIPAGKFRMGTEPPYRPVISLSMAWMMFWTGCVGVAALMIALTIDIAQRRKFSFSLRGLLVMTLACGLAVGGFARWRLAVKEEYVCGERNNEYFRSHPYETRACSILISWPFYMGKYPVTQEQYEAVVGRNAGWFKGDQNPVERVTWFNAQDYCRKTRELLKANGQHEPALELPTEEQWEYACRAGTQTLFYSGDTDADLNRVAWYYGNSGKTTHPVGQKEPNAFGLYDMHGNVRQWCADYFDKSMSLEERATRGGSWQDPADHCRAAYRSSNGAAVHEKNVGLRLAMEIP